MPSKSDQRRVQAQTHCDRGVELLDRREPARALAEFEQAVALTPNSADARYLIAVALARLERLDEAEACLRVVLETDRTHIDAAHLLGTLLHRRGLDTAALLWLRDAAQRGPDRAQLHRDLAVISLFVGDIAAAKASFVRVLELDPTSDEVIFNLVRLIDMASDDPHAAAAAAAMARLESSLDSLPDALRVQLLFSMAKTSHDFGEIDRAFDLYLEANAAMRALVDYSIEAEEARFAAVERQFDRALFARLAGQGAPNSRPVFVTGMPRSGTTLVEQILSAHPAVMAAGEIPAMLELVTDARGLGGVRFPDWVGPMTADDCLNLGRTYLGKAPSGARGHLKVTDKRLENIEYIGLIHLILPRVPIIHCRRDPADTCLSAFTLLFSMGQDYSYSLEELGRYWRAYDRLMAHWAQVLPPGVMLDVPYEALVAEPETWARRIVAHCGLDWDPACLDFHKSARGVTSASAAQVRQPIYDRSIGRWRPFAHRLGPMFEAMGERFAAERVTPLSVGGGKG